MRVVERSSDDVMRETVELFDECKPFFDMGWGLHKTICTVKGLKSFSGSQAWYKRLRDYARIQGYEFDGVV